MSKIKWNNYINQGKLISLIDYDLIEYSAVQQIFNNLDSYKCIQKIIVMPDIHTGYGIPIGCVVLVIDHISPEFCGYDIGCGIIFLRLPIQFKKILKNERQKIKFHDTILKNIPTGVGVQHKKDQYYTKKFKSASGNKKLTHIINEKLAIQYGTLGSGNHFIEFGEDPNGYFCITIHSGSRRPGWEIGDYYMKESSKFNRLIPLEHELAQSYIQDALFMQQFALDNRLKMMKDILNLLGFRWKEFKTQIVNENHNHFEFRPNSMVLHRKGATPAEDGQLGVIPGNMRDGVYLTIGLGSEEYLCSSSHGAGRKMSRSKAKQLNLNKFKKDMSGIICTVNETTLDECPDAYKNVHDIIQLQEGVVINVVEHIKSIINVKG